MPGSTTTKVQEDLNLIADQLAELQSIPGSPLSNLDQKKQMFRELLQKGLETQHKECEKGMALIAESVLPEEKAQFNKEMVQLSEHLKKIQDLNLTPKEGQNLQSLCHISNFLLDIFYRKAAACFNAGQWAEAVSCFTILSLIDPQSYEYTSFLGTAFLHLEKFEEALGAFLRAFPQAPDTSVYFPIAGCLGKLNLLEEAKQFLDEAITEEQISPQINQERLSQFKKLRQQLGGK